MRAVRNVCLALSVAVFALPGRAEAQERRAIVVGIDAYANLPKLAKSVRDAEAIGAALTGLGFAVTVSRNAGREELLGAFRDFTGALGAAPQPVTTLVYIAAHAVDVEGVNYLFAADASGATNAERTRVEMIAAPALLAMIREKTAGPIILVFDSCRDNPMADATRGMKHPATVTGIFVLYSAAGGQCGFESYTPTVDDKPSPFAAALARLLPAPGADLAAIARAVQSEVIDAARAAGLDQRPTFYDDLGGVALTLGK